MFGKQKRRYIKTRLLVEEVTKQERCNILGRNDRFPYSCNHYSLCVFINFISLFFADKIGYLMIMLQLTRMSRNNPLSFGVMVSPTSKDEPQKGGLTNMTSLDLPWLEPPCLEVIRPKYKGLSIGRWTRKFLGHHREWLVKFHK